MSRTQWLLPDLDTLDDLKHVLLDMEDGCTFTVSTGADISGCRCDWCKEQKSNQPWVDEATLRVEVAFVIFNPAYGMYTYVGVNFFLIVVATSISLSTSCPPGLIRLRLL